MPLEEPGKGRETVDPEEILSYWFPEKTSSMLAERRSGARCGGGSRADPR
jgi:hypothetical protein